MTVLLKSLHPLPILPLDQQIPSFALRRRGGVSFTSSDVKHSYDVVALQKKRRCGISYESKDSNAEYVRMLGDMKAGCSSGSMQDGHHSDSLIDHPQLDEDIQQLVPSDNMKRFSLRYASLHKTRRKARPIFKVHDNASVLDSQYSGQTWCLLSRIGDWEFDIFNLDKLSNGRALFHVGLQLFQEHNLIETFQLDIMKLMRCITLLEEGYHSANPYHNAVHAADVAQAMHCYLMEKRVQHYITPLEKLTAIMAALAHDLDHPGVNQAFLIATSNHLAALYNNTSVLENHHWRTAIGVFHESGVFDHFSDSSWKTIEWQMKSLILATDITRQQEFLSKLKLVIDNNELDMTSEDHRHFMLQIGLKCADICNPCRVWEVSRKWSELVCDEFFKQGDYERKLLLPVTPLCDRNGTTVAKIQSGFMQFVVLPLFEEWYRFSPTKLSQVMLDNIKSNKTNWDDMVKQDQAKKAKEEQEINAIPEENEDLNSSSCSSKEEGEKEGGEEADREDEDEEVSNRPDATREAVDIETQGSSVSVDQQVVADPTSVPSPRTPRVSECEKENSNPQTLLQQQQEIEVLSQAESDLLIEQGEDIDDMEVPVYFPRRHSLPVSTGGWKPHEQIKVVQQPLQETSDRGGKQQPMWPVMPSVGRRHSLPTARLLPINSFDKLTEKLFSVKEVSPTDASSAFEFDRWGTRIPHVSLNSSTLMNVSLEASKLTDAHGLNQVMLHQQRKYQSEPHVTIQSSTNKSNQSPSLGKLSQSPSSTLHGLRPTGASQDSASLKTINNEANTNSKSNSSSQPPAPHTFHSTPATGALHNNNTSPSVLTANCLRRSSLNSPQRNNNSVLPSNNSNTSAALPASSLIGGDLPRRASLGDKPRHSPYSTTDTEAQPLLPKHCANSGDQCTDDCMDSPPLPPSCYYNSSVVVGDCSPTSHSSSSPLSGAAPSQESHHIPPHRHSILTSSTAPP